MFKQPGFYLIDCMIALVAFLMAAGANIQLAQSAAKAMALYQERQVARTILVSAQHLPQAFHETHDERFFDEQGQAVPGPAKFRLTILKENRDAELSFTLALCYQDLDGSDQQLTVKRVYWSHHAGI